MEDNMPGHNLSGVSAKGLPHLLHLMVFLAAILTSFSVASSAYSASASLTWDPVTATTLTGYRIYYGTSSRSYTASVTLGDVTAGTVPNLAEGTTYFFAVTSLGDGNEESDYSEEVSCTIPSANLAPVAQDTSLSTDEDTPESCTLIATDGDGDPLSFSIVAQGTLGTAVVTNASSGSVAYTPKPNAFGTDTFTYKASDGKSNSNTATVTVTISPVNDAPIALGDSVSTSRNTPVIINVLANDTDVDGDVLTTASFTQGLHGTVQVSGASLLYTPFPDFNGNDSFSYTVSDGHDATATATVTVAVVIPNEPPVAQQSAIGTTEDTPGSGTLIAADGNGDPLTFSVVAQGTLGTVVVTNPSIGSFTYTPKSNAFGTDAFTFRASDGKANSNTATVTVTISPVNDAPTALNDAVSTPQNTAVTVDVLSNDTDADGDVLTVSTFTQGLNGTVRLDNGFLRYTPNTAFNGTDSFNYTVADGCGGTASATVTVAVVAANSAPLAYNKNVQALANKPVSSLLKATDPEKDPLTFSIVSNGTRGTAVLNNPVNGAFTYTPNSNVTGTDTFTFKANDGKRDSNTAVVTVKIKNNRTAVVVEAEEASMFSTPMTKGSDASASGGGYIWVPTGTGSISTPFQEGGSAHYVFKVPSAGKYRLWVREQSRNAAHNSFFISLDGGDFLPCNTALVKQWEWEQLRIGNSGKPLVVHLTPGEHTLRIKQKEDGTRIDKLLLSTNPRHFPSTVYSYGAAGVFGDWSITDPDPPGGRIITIPDIERESVVVSLSGSGIRNEYHLGSDHEGWHNSRQFDLQWSMKFAEDYLISVHLKTTAGYRRIVYQPMDLDFIEKHGDTVKCGLGSSTRNGEWHTIIRDLRADLGRVLPGITILEVNGISVRGSGRIDNVRLR